MTATPDELTPTVLLGVLRAFPWLTIGLPVAGAALFLVLALLRPPEYRVTAIFLPVPDPAPVTETGGGLLGQFGGRGAAGETEAPPPDFYLELLNSRRVLSSVLRDPVTDRAGATLDLAERWGVAEPDAGRREEALIRELRKRLAVRSGYLSGLVYVTVDARDPLVASALVGRLLDATDRFNREDRRSTARGEREFLEERVADVRAARAGSEDTLAAFLARNRGSVRDPELRFTEERLRADVERLRTQESGLIGALEAARMAEVRTTPVMTVVQPATPPARPRPRRLLLFATLGLMVGGLVGWSVATWRASLDVARSHDRSDWRRLQAAGDRGGDEG